VPPSPKLQLYVYGDIPPAADPVNVTDWLDNGCDGLYEKLATRAETGETVTVCVDFTDPPAESAAVKVTV
jgi:hypothetical protein